MKKMVRKSAICFIVVICLLLNSYSIFTGFFIKEPANNEVSDSISEIIYSSDNNVSFDKAAPVYQENGEAGKISVRRSGEVSAPLTVTVVIYDNSADYAADYIVKYNGKSIEKIAGSRSIFGAFRDEGTLSSNLPVNAADVLVSYSEPSAEESAGDVNASDMLSQLDQMNACVAEFEVTFGAGEAIVDIYIEPIDDEISEYDESFILVLLGRDGNVVENSQILCDIEDNEEDPSVYIEFDETKIKANEESGVAQVEFTRSGNLATGTSALLLRNEEPIGYVDFSPYQSKQVVLAIPGTYRLASVGNYTVSEDLLLVSGTAKDVGQQVPKGADPELDAVPDQYEPMPQMVQGEPNISKFPSWVQKAEETDDYIVVLGDSSNGLFDRDSSSTDGNVTFLSSNLYQLDTEGGSSQGYLFLRTKDRYNLNGIASVEGSVYISDLTTGYCDVIFGVWNQGHAKIYTNDNKSTQNLTYEIGTNMGTQFIYYCNSDLKGNWDCGWNAYTPNGFKLNKREYTVIIDNPASLDYTGVSSAPTMVSQDVVNLKMHSSKAKISLAYVNSEDYPARLVGYKFLNKATLQTSEVITLTEQEINFTQDFLNQYDARWGYDTADSSGNVKRTFTIIPVFEKIEIDYSIKKTSNGSLTLESPKTPCVGDTLTFKGQGNDGYNFTGVLVQYRMSEGGEIMRSYVENTTDGKTVSLVFDQHYAHVTFQGVFGESGDKLFVNYSDTNAKGKLKVDAGLVLSGDKYLIGDYYPLMAEPNEGYITVWESAGNYYFGDIFNYQLDGSELNSNVLVKFVADGEYLVSGDESTKVVLKNGKISGKLTRNDLNLFDKTVVDIPLSKTNYTITTSHGTYSGVTDENGNYTIDGFMGVLGGTYSIAINYQGRIGYATFEYKGEGSDYNIAFPQFAVGGFYPVEVTATVDGQGHGSNALNLTSSGKVQLTAKIYIHSNEYKISEVKFHFLSTLADDYGKEVKVLSAKYSENANMGERYQLWTLELTDSSEVPENTRIYVTVSGEYAYSEEDVVVTTIDRVNSGLIVQKAAEKESELYPHSIPSIPGIQSADGVDVSNFEIPILGVLDMGFTSKTGGYFVQQGSWDNVGDRYTLVCGHSARPNYLTGMVKEKYKKAQETKKLLGAAAAGDPKGTAELKQKAATQYEILPVFAITLHGEVVDNGEGGTTRKLIGFDIAVGVEAYVSKNVPFNVSGVPCYVCISMTSEAYCQMQIALSQGIDYGSNIDNLISDLQAQAGADINAFLAAPILEFGLKGGVGFNGWAGIYASGTIKSPFIVGFTPLDAAGEVSFKIGVGAELALFTAEIKYENTLGKYGNDDLYGDLQTIQSAKEPEVAAYRVASGKSYNTLEEAINNANFTVMERPNSDGNKLLQSGAIDNSVLAESVFKNTKIKLLELGNGNIMALFLVDNDIEDSFNYLSVAYAISEDNGKTWKDVQYVSKTDITADSSLQYDINVFELDGRILVTWSEADFDGLLKDVDPNKLTAAQMATVINAMNLNGRFFDIQTGEAIGEAFTIAENSAVFCGALDAVQNGDNVYVYYQRTALSTAENVTVEELLKTQRTIAMACANVNDTSEWTSTAVRALSDEGGQYLIVDVEPFVHDGILGEIVVLDRNGMAMTYGTESQSLVPNVEDRQLFIRTYSFDESGVPTTTALMPITDSDDCAQSPQVVSNDDYLYLFWNHNGEIVYASDFVAKCEGSFEDAKDEAGNIDLSKALDNSVLLEKALVVVDSDGTHKANGESKFSPSYISSDESLHVGSTFTVAMSEEGKVFICWIANDKEDESSIPTDEIYGMMLESKLVSDVVSDVDNVSSGAPSTDANEIIVDTYAETQLFAVGSPVAVTDGNHSIGALASICFKEGEESKFLLVYSKLNGTTLRDSTSAKIIAATSVDEPDISAEIEFTDYPMAGETEKAYITVYNAGFHSLSGYSVTISGLGEDIKLTSNTSVMPGRTEEICVDIPVPADFAKATTLKVSVVGIGEQEKYKAEATTEVLYGAYFVPTDIPSVEAVPNSNDCIVKIGVKNVGNAAGSPELEYLNAIYATDDENEILKYKNSASVTVSPNGEATVSYTMTDTHIGSGKYSTVQVHMGDNYDQSTEAPMPNPITITIEDVAYIPEVEDEGDEDESETDVGVDESIDSESADNNTNLPDGMGDANPADQTQDNTVLYVVLAASFGTALLAAAIIFAVVKVKKSKNGVAEPTNENVDESDAKVEEPAEETVVEPDAEAEEIADEEPKDDSEEK